MQRFNGRLEGEKKEEIFRHHLSAVVLRRVLPRAPARKPSLKIWDM